MDGRLCSSDVLIFTAMVATECSNVALNSLFKAAASKGMSSYVFLVYSFAIGVFLLPAPFFSLRSRVLPSLSFSIFWKICLLGIIGSVYLLAGYTGIKYSSPTLASAMSNLTPAFTFILAIFFRMEKICLKKSSGVAKVLGTILSVSGAFVVTLYKGPVIFIASQPSVSIVRQPLTRSSDSNWAIGGAFLALEYTLVPVSYIVQAQIMKVYPNEFVVIFIYSLWISIITGPAGLIMEKNNPNAWKINSGIAWACIVFSGLFGTCGYCTVHTWGVRLKGPVFVAMFKPLSIVIAVGMGALFLGDSLYLGSLIGGTLIALGFYTVMWGKAKEEHKVEKDISKSSESTAASPKTPLLKTYKEEEYV